MKDSLSVFLPYLATGLLIVCHYGILSFEVYKPQGICVFGDNPDCFFQCHCKMKCSEPNCQNCHPLTGACFGDDVYSCEEQQYQNVGTDKEKINPYSESYWKGPACQIGNLAKNQASEFEKGTPAFDSIKHLTDGSFDHVANLTFTEMEYWLVTLKDISKVRFVDFLVTQSPGARTFDDNLDLSLGIRKNGSFKSSVPCNHVAGDHLLSADFHIKLKQIHYTCSLPSVGNIVKIQSKSGINFPFSVKISEVIVIGYKYIENKFLDDGSCMEASNPSYILRWCIKCKDSLPPDCSIPCSEGKTGINCVNDTAVDKKSTQEVSPESTANTFLNIPHVIVIAVLGTIFTVIAIGFLVWYTHNRKESKYKKQNRLNELINEAIPLNNLQNVPSNGAIPRNNLHVIPPAPQMRDDEHTNAYHNVDEVESPSKGYINRTHADGTTSETTEPAFNETQQLGQPTPQSVESSNITPANIENDSSYLSFNDQVFNSVEEEKQKPASLNVGLGFHVPVQPKQKSDGISGDENNIDSPRKDDDIADDGVSHPISESSDYLLPLNQRK